MTRDLEAKRYKKKKKKKAKVEASKIIGFPD